LCCRGAPDDFFARVVRTAKALGAKSVTDTSGTVLAAVLEEGVTIIKPNLIELMEFVAVPLDREADRVAACRKLASDGCAEIVALTLGEHGALLVTAERAWRALPLAIEAVSTVGAGDSFLGGLVAALSGGKPLEEAFRVAVAAASAAVLMLGTGLFQPEDVKRLLQKISIEEITRVPT
jgi:6-phosphofructokinase 2